MDFRAIILVPAIAGCVAVGFPLALLASNAYLAILQGTGAGAKRIAWPSESIPDHIPKFLYLAWLLGLWLGPAYFLGRWAGAAAQSSALEYVVPLLTLWLVFPVSQLSSLAGPTPWLPLWPDVFVRLAQKPGVLLGYFGLSGLVLALAGLGLYGMFGGGHWAFFVAGAPLLVVSGLLYARLLGRLAFVLTFTRSLSALRKKARKGRRAETIVEEAPASEQAEAPYGPIQQPSAMAPLQTPSDGPLTGYNVRFEEPPPRPAPVPLDVPFAPRKPGPRLQLPSEEPVPPAVKRRREALDRSRRWDDEDDDATPYDAHAPEIAANPIAPKGLLTPSAREMALLSREDAPRKPKHAWTGELFAFFDQPETWSAIVWLSVLCGVVGGLIRLARAFNPAAEAET